MSEIKWKFQFRQDQCEFIISAMDYIIARADERIDGVKHPPFEKFAARVTRERADDIRAEISDIIG